jgi:hypothetical protein
MLPARAFVLRGVGRFAWFVMLFSLFARFMPIISMTELKEGIAWRK